jgi:hypothetical protein
MLKPGFEKLAIKGFLRALLRARRSSNSLKKSDGGPVKESIPKVFQNSINNKNYERAWRGYREAGGGGVDSLVSYIPLAIAEKLIGKKKVRGAVWKYVNAPSLVTDTAVGKGLSKVPLVGKKLFTTNEKVPWGKDTFKEIERSSALAPLVKARNIGAPIMIGVGLEKGFNKVHEAISAPKERDRMKSDYELREKVASTMLRLNDEVKEHTKRAHALRLIYKQAEMGVGYLPQSYGELEEKLASLLNQDLIVYEKALELAGGSIKLGELSSSDMKNLNALEQFQAAVLGDDA